MEAQAHKVCTHKTTDLWDHHKTLLLSALRLLPISLRMSYAGGEDNVAWHKVTILADRRCLLTGPSMSAATTLDRPTRPRYRLTVNQRQCTNDHNRLTTHCYHGVTDAPSRQRHTRVINSHRQASRAGVSVQSELQQQHSVSSTSTNTGTTAQTQCQAGTLAWRINWITFSTWRNGLAKDSSSRWSYHMSSGYFGSFVTWAFLKSQLLIN